MTGHLPVWPVAALALPAGFAVAQASGVRPLGGAVMLALLGACAWWRWGASRVALLAVGGVAVASFVASHLLHDALGVAGAVGLAGVVTGCAAFVLLDRAEVPRRTSTAH